MFRCQKPAATLIAVLIVMVGYNAARAQMIEINGEIFRDPTQPPNIVYQEVAAASISDAPRINLSNFSLSFVRSGGLNPVAVINDRTVTEGDVIDGVVIAAIRPGAVVLMIEGEEQVLNLFGRPVRQAVE
ncbi:MAG: hypothetical protein Q7W55_01260 [Pseudohongiella sp.]|nr:hypothetical protein [Pseudohongiella sp.]MDO9520470.1 hypothetical protein [Pseudohongiella sp.]MDP2126522.1 hypothetical protein [Pseudohongiella sp.]